MIKIDDKITHTCSIKSTQSNSVYLGSVSVFLDYQFNEFIDHNMLIYRYK